MIDSQLLANLVVGGELFDGRSSKIMNITALTFIGLSILSTRTLAQDSATVAPSSAKPGCVIPVAPTDSINQVLYLRLASVEDFVSSPGKPQAKERRTQLALMLQEIRGFVEIPRPLVLPIGPSTGFAYVGSEKSDGPVVPDLESTVQFTLHSHGGVSGLSVQPPARVPQLDSALGVALQRAGAAAVLAGLLTASGRDVADSSSFRLGITPAEKGPAVREPFFRAKLPRYTRTIPVPHTENDTPKYPKRAREMGIDGKVLMNFVVDSSGMIDPETVDVMEASYLDFIKVIFDEMPRWRYRSSTVNGCRVPQRVQQQFVFRFTERRAQANQEVRPWVPPISW
ncbi:MAG: energy transducer TonB [Anaerolineae bacterium]|nr:energy transducer TonB [Gemmatimonadaceae bacterium]